MQLIGKLPSLLYKTSLINSLIQQHFSNYQMHCCSSFKGGCVLRKSLKAKGIETFSKNCVTTSKKVYQYFVQFWKFDNNWRTWFTFRRFDLIFHQSVFHFLFHFGIQKEEEKDTIYWSLCKNAINNTHNFVYLLFQHKNTSNFQFLWLYLRCSTLREKRNKNLIFKDL